MKLIVKESKKRRDCEVLADGVENVFSNLGNCFETVLDDKKTKSNVVGSIFSLGKSLTKLAFNTGVCAVKTAPKVVVGAAALKRELTTAVEDEIREYQKELKKDALDEKIRQLKLKA